MASNCSGKLADTTFVAGADDKLGVVDVYTQTTSKIANSYQKAFHEVGDALDSFLGGLGQINKLGDFIGSNLNNITNAINSVQGQANSFLGGFNRNPISALSGLVGNNIPGLSNILNTAGQAQNLFNDTRRNIESLRRNADNLAGGLNRLVGSNSLLNQIENSIRNFGNLNPLSNSLSGSINNDLNDMFGGDRTVVTSNIKPPFNRVNSLANPTRIDRQLTDLDRQSYIDSFTNPSISSAINDLSPNAQEVLIRGVNNQRVNNSNVVAYNGVAARVDNQVSNQNTEAIGTLLNEFTNNNINTVIENNGSNASLISGLTHLASKAGFPDVFQSLAKTNDIKVMTEAAEPLLKRACQEGDFEIIRDICQTDVAKDAKFILPSLVESVIEGVQKPDNLTQQQYAEYYKSIKNTFNRVDSKWSKFLACDQELVNAIGVCYNPFFCDLIEAQLNELQSSEKNLSNHQVVYPLNGLDDETATLNKIALPAPTITYDEDGNEIVTPAPLYQPKEKLKVDPKDYEDEPFLLLAKVFINHDVDTCIRDHFPFFYVSLPNTPIKAI